MDIFPDDTSTLFGPFLPSPATIISHQQAFRTAIYIAIGIDGCLRAARKRGEDGTTVVREYGGEIYGQQLSYLRLC
jgi:hypothetical protein